MISVLSEDILPDACDYSIPVSYDNIYTVEMSVNNDVGSTNTTADPFSKFIIITNIIIIIIMFISPKLLPGLEMYKLKM